MGGQQSNNMIQTSECTSSVHDVAHLMKEDGYEYINSDGLPVFMRINGCTRPSTTGSSYGGTYIRKEYATLKTNKAGYVCLCDVDRHKQGKLPWTGDRRMGLITSFNKATRNLGGGEGVRPHSSEGGVADPVMWSSSYK